MPHIRLSRFRDEERHVRGRSRALPIRNQGQHGAALRQELAEAVREHEAARIARPRDLPPLPETLQLVLKAAQTATGKPLLDRAEIPKGWKLEVIEERRDGSLVTLSRDPNAAALNAAIENSDEMDEKDDQIAHHRILARREIPMNYGRNNNSPATRAGVRYHCALQERRD
jgi:hypothetical protein